MFSEAFSFEGIQLWVRILPRFRGIYLPARLAWYRIVAGSLSRATETHRRIQLDVLRLMTALRADRLYEPWRPQIDARCVRALRSLVADALRRRDPGDFETLYREWVPSAPPLRSAQFTD